MSEPCRDFACNLRVSERKISQIYNESMSVFDPPMSPIKAARDQ